MAATSELLAMPKKKSAPTSKRRGTLIRVSNELADALGDVTGLERTNIADWADTHLLPIVRKRYSDVVIKVADRIKEAKRLKGGEK